MNRSPRDRWLMILRTTALALSISVCGAAIVATAATPAPSGLIQGCVNGENGALRVVTDISLCRSYETALTWTRGLVWRGTYSSAVAYAVNDAVQSGGSSYIAVAQVIPVPCSGFCIDANAPGLSASWQLLAARGAVGPAGQPGPAGATSALEVEQVDVVVEIAPQWDAFLNRNPATTVLHLDLPGRNYVVFAQVTLINRNDAVLGNNDRDVACELRPDAVTGPVGQAGHYSRGQARVWADGASLGTTLNLQLAYPATAAEQGDPSLPASRGVDVVCDVHGAVGDPASGVIANARIDAIEVSSLTTRDVVRPRN